MSTPLEVITYRAGRRLCGCGCGNPTPLASRTRTGRKIGLPTVKGMGTKFLAGHHSRRPGPDFDEDPTTGCWIWTRVIASNGYGLYRLLGRHMAAHRAYYQDLIGPIPKGLDLDHLCRNRACVNPGHLEPVTRAVNLQRGATTKLTPELADRIRAAGGSSRAVGHRLGVSHSMVQAVRNRTSWVDRSAA